MITITPRQMIDSVDGLRSLLSVKLPVKVAYRVSKLVNNKIQPELNAYEEQRAELVRQYGAKDEKGNFSVLPENLTVFHEKVAEVQAIEVQLDWEPLNIDELGEIQVDAKSIVPWLFV